MPTALAALGAGVAVNVVPPRYTGETQLVLESREPAGNAAIDEQAAANR